METVIARLLQDFESGKMTRRQLIQSLALAAVAAPAATAAAQGSQAASGAAPWKTVWLDHISYAVSDYKKSTDFYANLMGWKVVSDDGSRQATLNIGDIGQIIIRNGRRPADPATPAPAPAPTDSAGQARQPITGVINHISFGIEPWDTEGVKAELERRGLRPRPDMVGENFKSYHVRDPDGWDLQISNKTKASRD
jgi:catechol 2,3-dioxygenase-like lactoylglutathione lyase family enzyme